MTGALDTPGMNPIQRYAALKLLDHGLATAMKNAEVEAKQYAQDIGGKTMTSPWGTVTLADRKGTYTVDEDELLVTIAADRPDVIVETLDTNHENYQAILDWTAENHPAALKYSLDPLFVAAQKARKWIHEDGGLIDPETGEAVAWITYKPGTAYLTPTLTKEAKADATAQVAERMAAILTASTPKGIEKK